MDKFISVPVTGETNFLVSVSDVIAIQIGDAAGANPTTATTITYNSGNKVTPTHAAVTGNEFRDSLQSAMTAALATSWTNVVADYVPPTAVSAIAVV